jgi:D-aminopeptidase
VRLRDLGLAVGNLPAGPNNTITDVDGVSVGHARGAVGGITVVVPFADAPRRYYAGRWSLDGGDDTTGLAMLEDFGALSTPIALAPAPAVGRVYDGLLDYGFSQDPGLGEDEGWPPAVIAVDGVWAPAVSLHAALGVGQVAAALSTASHGAVPEGQVGVGQSLSAFGVRAGIGSSSRISDPGMVGVLVAANGGEPGHLTVDGIPVGRWLAGQAALPLSRRRAFAGVIVTDAPLLPGQLQRLAQRAAFGLIRVGLVDELTTTGTVIAVSTTGLDDGLAGLTPGTVTARATPESALPALYAAGADTCEEAVLNCLVAAHKQISSDGVPGLPVDAFRAAAVR